MKKKKKSRILTLFDVKAMNECALKAIVSVRRHNENTWKNWKQLKISRSCALLNDVMFVVLRWVVLGTHCTWNFLRCLFVNINMYPHEQVSDGCGVQEPIAALSSNGQICLMGNGRFFSPAPILVYLRFAFTCFSHRFRQFCNGVKFYTLLRMKGIWLERCFRFDFCLVQFFFWSICFSS